MHLSEDEARPAYDDELDRLMAGPATFESTVRSFEVKARDIRRGFKVNQAINSLKIPSSVIAVARLASDRNCDSIIYTSGKSKQP